MYRTSLSGQNPSYVRRHRANGGKGSEVRLTVNYPEQVGKRLKSVASPISQARALCGGRYAVRA